MSSGVSMCFFFFNDTATTEIYTLSLHDALPISDPVAGIGVAVPRLAHAARVDQGRPLRSEEHTSELQSPCNLVCRLLLEKKKAAIGRAGVCCGRLGMFGVCHRREQMVRSTLSQI